MDRKHAMLYPTLDGDGNSTMSNDQRLSASAAIGLPTELPPSYDMAMRGNSGGGATSAPAAAYPTVIVEDPGQGLSTPPTTGPNEITNATDARRTSNNSLAPDPGAATCPKCGQCPATRKRFTPTTGTHLCAFFLCLVGWCCCACLVPYCMIGCRNRHPHCTRCNVIK